MNLKTQLLTTVVQMSPQDKAQRYFNEISEGEAFFWYTKAKYNSLRFNEECESLGICPVTFKRLCYAVYRERSEEYNS